MVGKLFTCINLRGMRLKGRQPLEKENVYGEPPEWVNHVSGFHVHDIFIKN